MSPKPAQPAQPETPQDPTPIPTPIAPPAAAPTTSVLKATELIQKAISGVPQLATESQAMTLVFGAYAQIVVTKVDKRKAAQLLDAFFNVKPAAIQVAVLKLNKVIEKASGQIAADVQEQMGIDINPATLDIKKRSKEEVDEQNGLDEQADAAIANVQTVVTSLGVRDLYAEELAAQGKKPRKSLKDAIVKKAVETGWLSSTNGRAVDMEPEEPGWNTPPVFDTSDKELSRLLAKLDGVLTLISDNAGSPTLREQVEIQLANFNVTIPDLEQTLYKISKLAHEQLDQSAKILDRVRDDQAHLAKQIEAINFVKGIYASVLQYFFPGS